MNKKNRIAVLIVSLILLAPCLLSAEDIHIQVRLFQGEWDEDQEELKQDVLLTTSSTPEMAPLKAKARGPQNEFIAAVIDALMEVMDLRTLDDLGWLGGTLNERDSNLSHTILHEHVAFRFTFIPKQLSPQKLSLQTVVFKTKDDIVPSQAGESLGKERGRLIKASENEGQMEKILDKKIVLELGDPVIVGVPYRGRAYFLMILLTSGTETPGELVFSGGPKPVHKVIPAYPDELRQQGVEGQVKLQVAIDEEGTVQGVRVVKILHPYLDNAAVQALKQWKFEPFLYNGKPVPTELTMVVNFTKEAYRLLKETIETEETPPPSPESSSDEELRIVLDPCAEYCQKLMRSALDYICEETIRDIFYNFYDDEEGRILLSIAARPIQYPGGMIKFKPRRFVPFFSARRTERNKYVCDYLLVKTGERIEDRRIILKENGRKVPGRKKFLEEKRFSALMPLLAPVRLLGKDRQSLFTYRIFEETKFKGKKVYVIEALPKSGDAGGIEHAKIWVGKKNFQILKIEIEGVPLEGYESVLEEATEYNIKPKFTTTYLYQVEKNDLMFPSRLTIRVGYPDPGFSLEFYRKKIETDVKYDNYKFFTVETEHAIKKGDD